MEMQLVIAKCARFYHDDRRIKEYQKAIKMAQDEGSSDALKKCYLQQITEFVDVRDCIVYGPALDAIENYLKLDDSNAKVYTCLGVVHLKNEDYKGAIESFQKSLKLNNKDCLVGLALLRSLSKIKDYEGVMSVIEYHQVPIVGSWLSDGFIIPNKDMHEDIVIAARTFNKLDMGIKCYEYAYQNTRLSEEELKKAKDADSMKTAQQTLKFRTSRVVWSSMIRVYLGWLYLETLGQPDEAFELWKTGFFRCSEFLNLSNVTTSAGFTMDTIPKLFALFSQLIYEKALDPDPVVVGQMISHLEHLSRRQNVFYELNKSFFRYRTRIVDFPLAKLYLKHGRNDEGRKMLNELFQSTMYIIRDGKALYTYSGYGALAALLYLTGQLERAKVASSLRRRDLQKPEPSEGDFIYYNWPLECVGRCTRGTPLKRIPWGATLYTCTTCVNISFCENCYDTLQYKTGKRKVFVCSASHNFIKTPLDGLEKIKDGIMTVNGTSIAIEDWLTETQKEWKTGLCFKS
jgi:tetratricopeptide (TPR) repeat protein